MSTINITGYIGDKEITVELSQPSGNGDIYHIMIGSFYHGQAVKASGKWAVYLTPKSELSAEDIDVILDVLNEKAPA